MTKVLVADDQPMMRKLICATLAIDNLDVVEASDGDEAWELLETTRPDLAVLDVQMPGRTGIELTRAIRASADLAETHIILLTATAQESEIADGLAAGANRYITKPFSPLELLEEIEKELGLK